MPATNTIVVETFAFLTIGSIFYSSRASLTRPNFLEEIYTEKKEKKKYARPEIYKFFPYIPLIIPRTSSWNSDKRSVHLSRILYDERDIGLIRVTRQLSVFRGGDFFSRGQGQSE